MPIAIRTAQVREALLPFLGTDVLAQTALAEQAAEALRRFVPHHQPLEALQEQLCRLLFDELYAHLGQRMTLRLDNGQLVRVRVADIPDLADSVLGVLLDSLPENQSTLDLLRGYAMQTTSLSAMRALLLRFGSCQSPDEQAILRRIIRDNYPPERYAAWLQ
ncbi:MAG: hypothetical protein J1E43_09075 [Christensenellaceae bacterium]|nr:hypothetical protein [Christensenellaceae bacterium]